MMRRVDDVDIGANKLRRRSYSRMVENPEGNPHEREVAICDLCHRGPNVFPTIRATARIEARPLS